MKRVVPLVLLLLPYFAQAQQGRVDSLQNLIRELSLKPSSIANDTAKVNALNFLARDIISSGDVDAGDSLARIALSLSEKHKFRKGICKSLNNIGIVHFYQGDFTVAMNYYSKSLKIAEEIGDKRSIAANLGNLGVVSVEQGSYTNALSYYFKALKLYEELKDKNGTAKNLGNIGNIFLNQNEFDKALKYYFRALKLAEETGYKQAIANTLGNIGGAYYGKKEQEKALEYYFKALKINEEIGDMAGMSRNYGNIGVSYDELKNFSGAYEYYKKSLEINRTIGNKAGEGLGLGNIGSMFAKQGKLNEAEKYLKQALAISTEVGDLDGKKEWLHTLSMLYSQQGKWKMAMDAYKEFIATRDSLFNEENTKNTVKAEMNFEFEKKATADSVRHLEQQKVKDSAIKAQEAQLKQEKTQRYSLYGGLALVLVFSVFLLNRFKVTNRQKKEIEHQKLLVEEKNKEVIDSINYAKKIQDALLKEQDHVSEHLPEHFVFFKPKDIVSGDFYWGLEKQDHWYLCVADCTGHGVPGAFMSMLGIAFLNEINGTEELHSPARILDLLREKITKELGQSGESGESKDGMDISLMRLNLKTNAMEWAGANNPLWIIQDGDRKEIKADKQPIGFSHQPKPFTNHPLQLNKGDMIYLFSDGYADQFGGEKGKKFKYKNLFDLLSAMKDKSMSDQKQKLSETFESWKGKLEQVDDVLIIGLRL
jgi:serine phosphatase RsbU (regulator of sigma subunit)/Tfp pilus assembly protein PilF